jgi:FdhD protein
VGYVRGGKFTVYSHPERIEPYPDNDKIDGVTAAILAGGASSRMGTNKALLEVDGTQIISRTYQVLARLFHDVIIITNSPEEYDFLPCRKMPDLYPGVGSIAGLHSALAHSTSHRTFITACDMPYIEPDTIRHLCQLQQDGYDAVIPFSSGGQEPLHAVYAAACKDVFEKAILKNERKILDILERMNTRLVTWEEIQDINSGARRSFLNVNTPEEYEAIRHELHPVYEPEDRQKTS